MIDKSLDFGSKNESVGAFPNVLGGTDQPLSLPTSAGAGEPLYVNIYNTVVTSGPITGDVTFQLRTAATAAGAGAGTVLAQVTVTIEDAEGGGVDPGLVASFLLPPRPKNEEALLLEISAEAILGGQATFEGHIGSPPQTNRDNWS